MRVKNTGTKRVSFYLEGTRYGLAPDATQDFDDSKAALVLAQVAKQPDLVATYGLGGANTVAAALIGSADASGDTLGELEALAAAASAALVTHQNATGPHPLNKMSYTPGTPGDWASTAPTQVQQALDRMAALLKTLNSNTAIP